MYHPEELLGISCYLDGEIYRVEIGLLSEDQIAGAMSLMFFSLVNDSTLFTEMLSTSMPDKVWFEFLPDTLSIADDEEIVNIYSSCRTDHSVIYEIKTSLNGLDGYHSLYLYEEIDGLLMIAFLLFEEASWPAFRERAFASLSSIDWDPVAVSSVLRRRM